MGTRAAFWVGDPRNLDNRQWLGCVAWDGYPGGLTELADVQSLNDFHRVVAEYSSRDDFAHPEGGWPYPWDGDIFLTDYTYAWFDGDIHVSYFHTGWRTWEQQIADDGAEEERLDDPTFASAPAPSEYPGLGKQPDSILVFSMPRNEDAL